MGTLATVAAGWTSGTYRAWRQLRTFQSPLVTRWRTSSLWALFIRIERAPAFRLVRRKPRGRVSDAALSKLGISLYDWSPDGKQLLLSQQTSDYTIQISTLSAFPLSNSEPAPRKIAAKAGHYLWQPHFSPDGRWVVFLDQSIDLVSTQSIIYVTPATGGPWIRVTDGKFWDDKPQWAADGKTLYFLSRQGGFYDVWGIRFNSAEGKVTGDRFRVTNFASPSLMIPNYMGDVELSITRDKLALSMSQVSGSIWVLNDVDQ